MSSIYTLGTEQSKQHQGQDTLSCNDRWDARVGPVSADSYSRWEFGETRTK